MAKNGSIVVGKIKTPRCWGDFFGNLTIPYIGLLRLSSEDDSASIEELKPSEDETIDSSEYGEEQLESSAMGLRYASLARFFLSTWSFFFLANQLTLLPRILPYSISVKEIGYVSLMANQ
ncbi:MAG: hypothetical protein GX295_05660 [Syntrophomonadaceae bacterium]|nr:hypothetical protein [Syntrophomonadaceae bacterium]